MTELYKGPFVEPDESITLEEAIYRLKQMAEMHFGFFAHFMEAHRALCQKGRTEAELREFVSHLRDAYRAYFGMAYYETLEETRQSIGELKQ